ncbi:hypothetical protein [Levilactobacillus tujiorum]|uniref:Uncharacterized protein n=1 Tax=Levilactobacillus tujiorum TaxID=2912243 RepID=A0ABX1L6V8_9LACO|nr:hypothetical protein [Levilactobacillus tujiorum]MCH5465031.1 hypothetical protein [Levilactobacillus tujiorum]NLR12018.1 hypothetical protein [Lactobacillus sp. HBUAS51387]NLR29993.1 hypothetical protein [Levilactobacillus tujiorum]NLR31299.1 hypothetical protein [Levilactobacillus tujiorum]
MQNLITNGTTALSDRVATAYKELFSDLPVIDGQVVYPQMPDFQLTYFIQQALDRHYLVRLQFKSAPTAAPATVVGTLKEDAAGHLILKQSHALTTIVSRRLLRSIQRAH